MNALIALAVSESNTGYANSNVTQRLRLVHTAEVEYSEAGFNWTTTLDRLTNTADGFMDEVHSLRDTYGADAVVLIVNDTAFCGQAWLMTTVSNGFKTFAFSLVSRICAAGNYSFAHELGHNMGSHHDRANASGPGGLSLLLSGTRRRTTLSGPSWHTTAAGPVVRASTTGPIRRYRSAASPWGSSRRCLIRPTIAAP